MLRIRIAILNEFDNSFSFVEHKVYGELEIWNGCRVSSPHRGYQLVDDTIVIFLDYKEVCRTKNKEGARAVVASLLNGPGGLDGLEDLKDYLKIM